MASRKVLVIDDDAEVLESVSEHLKGEGYDVRATVSGAEGLLLAREFEPDLVILDILLDGSVATAGMPATELSDGFSVLRRLRSWSEVFVLMLTRTSAEPVKVAALQLGADDYVTKPFGLPELAARVGAILRRRADDTRASDEIVGQHLRIDPVSRRVHRDGELLSLTRIEFDLLYALALHRDQVLTRERLIRLVWGHDYHGDERLVDAHIRRVRKTVEPDPAHPIFVVTVHGTGYRFTD